MHEIKKKKAFISQFWGIFIPLKSSQGLLNYLLFDFVFYFYILLYFFLIYALLYEYILPANKTDVRVLKGSIVEETLSSVRSHDDQMKSSSDDLDKSSIVAFTTLSRKPKITTKRFDIFWIIFIRDAMINQYYKNFYLIISSSII